eukprot:6996095-Prorocentrum_lima.AAC.1
MLLSVSLAFKSCRVVAGAAPSNCPYKCRHTTIVKAMACLIGSATVSLEKPDKNAGRHSSTATSRA